MTLHGGRAHSESEFELKIRLEGDSSVSANVKEVRTVMYQTGERTQELNVS